MSEQRGKKEREECRMSKDENEIYDKSRCTRGKNGDLRSYTREVRPSRRRGRKGRERTTRERRRSRSLWRSRR